MALIVLDTSVFVSALISATGASREVLRRCLEKKCAPAMGDKLLNEFEDVLGRKEIFETSPLSSAEREELFDAFVAVCQWVQVFFLWRPNLPDEGDNHVVELAIACNAEAIVTLNTRDFGRGELQFPGLEVLTPAQFLRKTR